MAVEFEPESAGIVDSVEGNVDDAFGFGSVCSGYVLDACNSASAARNWIPPAHMAVSPAEKAAVSRRRPSHALRGDDVVVLDRLAFRLHCRGHGRGHGHDCYFDCIDWFDEGDLDHCCVALGERKRLAVLVVVIVDLCSFHPI